MYYVVELILRFPFCHSGTGTFAGKRTTKQCLH